MCSRAAKVQRAARKRREWRTSGERAWRGRSLWLLRGRSGCSVRVDDQSVDRWCRTPEPGWTQSGQLWVRLFDPQVAGNAAKLCHAEHSRSMPRSAPDRGSPSPGAACRASPARSHHEHSGRTRLGRAEQPEGPRALPGATDSEPPQGYPRGRLSLTGISPIRQAAARMPIRPCLRCSSSMYWANNSATNCRCAGFAAKSKATPRYKAWVESM